MPNRRSGGRDGGRAAKRRSDARDGGRAAKRRRQHLYLVIDDWLLGYSIRKVDLSDYDSNNSTELPRAFLGAERLPRAAFRLGARIGFPENFAAAFGTKIIAMPPKMHGTDAHPLVPSFPVPIIDVHTRALNFGPRPKVELVDPIYFPVGDKLFVLSSGSFQVLEEPRVLYSPPAEEPAEEPDCPRWEGSWCKLPRHPFKRWNVTSYAVHPDGRTIFVSTKRRATSATFTFDTTEARFVWNQHGAWALPFTGRAHFDCNLEVWVGLSGDPATKGYLCACDVSSAESDGSDSQCPSWKLSKEKLFSEDPVEKHVGASLVYLGGRSKFCLAQFVSIRRKGLDQPPPCTYLFRLTTFSLKFDKDGDLTTGNSRRVRYYKVPEVASGHDLRDPVVFWL